MDRKTDPEWSKLKKPVKIDNEIKAELKKAAIERAKDVNCHNNEVAEDDAIKNICKQKGITICKGCGGVNCGIWQTLYKKDNKPVKFL